MYPISAVLLAEHAAGWLTEDGFGHISTFGGAELGCIAALKALEICNRPETRSMVHYISDLVGRGLREIQADYPDWFVGIRAERRGDGPGVRPPAGREVRHAAPLRERRLGDLLHARPARAAVQARASCCGPSSARSCSTAPRSRSASAWAEVRRLRLARREGPGMTVDVRPAARRGRRCAARPADARARPVGGAGLRDVRPRLACCASSRRSPRAAEENAEKYAEWAVRETGFGVVERQGRQEPAVLARHPRRLPRPRLRDAADRRGAQDRRGASARRAWCSR